MWPATQRIFRLTPMRLGHVRTQRFPTGTAPHDEWRHAELVYGEHYTTARFKKAALHVEAWETARKKISINSRLRSCAISKHNLEPGDMIVFPPPTFS